MEKKYDGFSMQEAMRLTNTDSYDKAIVEFLRHG